MNYQGNLERTYMNMMDSKNAATLVMGRVINPLMT